MRKCLLISFLLMAVCFTTNAQLVADYKIPTIANSAVRIEQLKQQWTMLHNTPPNLGLRDCFLFILDAMDTKLYDQKDIEWLLNRMLTRVVTNPKAKNYGNIFWAWVDPKNEAEDNNNVEFCVQYGVLIKLLYNNQLSEGSRKALDKIFDYALIGITNADVRVSYTNIYLMRIWNLIALGQVYNKPAVIEEGRRHLNLWIKQLANFGNREYDSPTYGGVDLESLLLLSQFAKDKDIQEKVSTALNFFLTDFSAHYNQLGGFLGGAHSRDYNRAFSREILEEKYLNPLFGKPNNLTHLFHQICFTRLKELGLTAQQQALVNKKNKLIIQRWDSIPNAYAVDYVGNKVSIASSNQTYSPDDKPLVIYLCSKSIPEMANIAYDLEGRDDHYGQWSALGMGDKKINLRTANYPLNGGWGKARHLMPFMQVAQNKGEFVMLVAGEKDHNCINDYLNSTIILPNTFNEIWMGNTKISAPEVDAKTAFDASKTFFAKFEDVAIAFKILYDDAGSQSTAYLCNDGFQYNSNRPQLTNAHNNVMRITLQHSTNGKAVIAMWWKTQEGIRSAADFAKFRNQVLHAKVSAIESKGIIDVSVITSAGKLGVKANLNLKKRLDYYNPSPLPKDFLYNIDGLDVGKQIMQKYR